MKLAERMGNGRALAFLVTKIIRYVECLTKKSSLMTGRSRPSGTLEEASYMYIDLRSFDHII